MQRESLIQINLIVLIICFVAATAVALIAPFPEKRKTRLWISIALPVILAVNTLVLCPPVYVAFAYYAAMAALIVLQILTAVPNTKWMRISAGILLAALEIVLCIMLYRFFDIYYLEHMLY